MISYKGLKKILEEKKITKTELGHLLGISSRTIAKIAKGEKISRIVLYRLCHYFSCEIDDLCVEISSNPLLQLLRDEKQNHIRGGLYHELQVRMAYNSNHIEGSQLSEEQTRYIYETNTLYQEDEIKIDDILETIHHFEAVDYVIDCAEEILSEDIIKKLHYLLKRDTSDSHLDWFAVGDYKMRPNMVGGRATARPEVVHLKMAALIEEYNNKANISIEEIIAFHAKFEQIHPFQDGNGRVGRLIALKECLHHSIVPFLIEDSKKLFYYRGLQEWGHENGYLIDTCLDEQDTFKRLLDQLGVNHD